MVPDSQYCYYQGSNLGEKCFTNFGGRRGGGEYPMRYGLEQSKNLMTVHIAMDAGMENVIHTFRDAGIEPTGGRLRTLSRLRAGRGRYHGGADGRRPMPCWSTTGGSTSRP